MNNMIHTQHHLPNVNIIESAFGCRFLTYRITSPNSKPSKQFETRELFLDSITDTISFLIKDRNKRAHYI